MSFLYIGLDGEMSSADLAKGGKLIQIGIGFSSGESFVSDINPGKMQWNPIAAKVHNIPEERVAQAPLPAEVDGALYDWLASMGVDPDVRGRNTPVGWNVGAFDMPFVHDLLPRSASLFSRRTVDLNAICFALEGRVHNGMPVKASTWKKMSKAYAIDKIGHENAHDAGWDALMHIHCFDYLAATVRGVA